MTDATPITDPDGAGDWYCPNCGYLSGSRVTFHETCDECHSPVTWITVDRMDAVKVLEARIAELERGEGPTPAIMKPPAELEAALPGQCKVCGGEIPIGASARFCIDGSITCYDCATAECDECGHDIVRQADLIEEEIANRKALEKSDL